MKRSILYTDYRYKARHIIIEIKFSNNYVGINTSHIQLSERHNHIMDQYIFQFDIEVHLSGEEIEVQAWAPLEYDIDATQRDTAATRSPTKPTFQRTESGKP